MSTAEMPLLFRLCIYDFFVSVLGFALCYGNSSAVDYSDIEKLKNEIFANYHREIPPISNGSMYTDVKILFDGQHILKMNEKYSSLTVTGVLMMTWTDERLKWSQENHRGLNIVELSANKVWYPDMYLTFSQRHEGLLDGHTPVRVLYSGTVMWYPLVTMDAPCTANSKHYPLEKYKCFLHFQLWTRSGELLSLRTVGFPINAIQESGAGEWTLSHVSHKKGIPTGRRNVSAPGITVEITVHRSSSSFFWYLCYLPEVAISFVSLAGFWLRASTVARYLIGCSNFLMAGAHFLHLISTVPLWKSTPIIVECAAAFLFFSAAFLVLTVALTMPEVSAKCPPNSSRNAARSLFLSIIPGNGFRERFTRADEIDGSHGMTSLNDSNHRMTSITDGHRRVTSVNEDQTPASDWLKVSLIVDRVAFWVFCASYAILLVVLTSV